VAIRVSFWLQHGRELRPSNFCGETMAELYPLLMKPHFDARPWGARDLAPIYDKHVHPGEQPIGEAWLTWDKCQIANGPLAGMLLGDACKRFGRDLVGSAARETDRFPLLIKFLFPRGKLSVQVHPDDETAQKHGEPCGKSECWYVVEAEPTAQVALGLKPGTKRNDFERAIHENRAEELLNWVNLERGDLIYVDAGTVHTLGPGSIILETQQNSDTTYRLYDYGRPRELHLRQGLEAIKERTEAGKCQRTRIADCEEQLTATPCFAVNKLTLTDSKVFDADASSPRVLVAVDGCGVIETEGSSPVTFTRGEAVIIPASVRQFKVRPQWNVEFLFSWVPALVSAEP
jgi:mannose-6-phosphate isomerase